MKKRSNARGKFCDQSLVLKKRVPRWQQSAVKEFEDVLSQCERSMGFFLG